MRGWELAVVVVLLLGFIIIITFGPEVEEWVIRRKAARLAARARRRIRQRGYPRSL